MALFRVDDSKFWAQVDQSNACWLWLGRKTDLGYGWITRKKVFKSPLPAHRYAWYLHTGEIPTRWQFVCHSCDNPSCVNPRHLFLGTPQANNADRDAKGRGIFGEKHWAAKLSEENVREIRKSTGIGVRALGRKYGIGHRAILDVLQRKKWKHVN